MKIQMSRLLSRNILYAAVTILWGLLILGACAGDEHQKMLAHLEELERQNLADSVMTNDSLAERLAEYFDHHGTPNERMRAHYILGRTYADLGEAPAALNAYLDAVECADTTAVDCNYRTLSRTYGQMADVFYRQNLMQDYLKACDKSIRYAWMAKDTLQALGESAMKVAGYNRLEQYDSVISVFDEVFDDLVQYYGIEMAAQYTMLPISALLEKDQIEKCRYYFDIAERESGYFDSANNIQKGREVYYYYKGRYFLKTHQCDSAEYYFRKEMRTGSDVINQSMASRGLSLTFDKMHIPDSSAKYALYSYEMLDSVYSQMSTDEVAHISALYNYSRHQRQALENAERTHAANLRFIIAFTILVILVCIALFFLRQNNIERRKQSAKYRAAIVERNKLRTEIESLNANDYKAVMARKEQEIATLTQTIEQQSARFQQVTANDRLADFEGSSIVQAFNNKRTYHKGQTPPTDDEWETLTNQFRQDMPSAYSTMSFLSPLQLQVCILLLLGFEEGEIAYLRQTKPQVISNAKARANQKLFMSNDSASLKGNLMGLIASW